MTAAPAASSSSAAVLTVLSALVFAAPASGQGPGSATGTVLRLDAGTRAAALGGAYAAIGGDPDALFYNPASVGRGGGGVALGYQAYVEDVSIGSIAAGWSIGPVVVGLGVAYLDAGDIAEVVPDPRYDGERGSTTGETFGATEAVGRLAGAPLLDGRLSLGAALGLLTTDLAGAGRTGVFADAGAQLHAGPLSLGLALRNLGGSLSHREYGDAPIPGEARLGLSYRRPIVEGVDARVAADAIVGLEEETLGMALGAEVGLLPGDRAVSAVVRAGALLGDGEHLGRVRVGGGVGVAPVSLDYAYQSFRFFGGIHRFGIRWTP